MTRDDRVRLAYDRSGVRHGGQRVAGVDPDLGQRVSPPDLVDGAVHHQLPLVDQRDAIAERLDLIHMVRREDRAAAVPAAFQQQVLYQANIHRIQAGRRLVEDAELGVGESAPAICTFWDMPLLRRSTFQVETCGSSTPLQPLERPPARVGPREPLERAEVRDHIDHAQLGVEPALLRQIAKPVEVLAAPWLPEDTNRPRIGTDDVHETRMSVLLPAPFGPSNPKISPAGTSNVTPRSATVWP